MKIEAMFARWAPMLLSVLRIMSGLLFLAHGTAKYLNFPRGTPYAGTPMFSPSGIAGVFELVGGFLLVIGLFTRPVAFVLSGVMAVAYFMVHGPRNFFPILNAGELAIMFCFVFLYLAASGGGPLSADAMVRGKR